MAGRGGEGGSVGGGVCGQWRHCRAGRVQSSSEN